MSAERSVQAFTCSLVPGVIFYQCATIHAAISIANRRYYIVLTLAVAVGWPDISG